jgi:hypothetical protein
MNLVGSEYLVVSYDVNDLANLRSHGLFQPDRQVPDIVAVRIHEQHKQVPATSHHLVNDGCYRSLYMMGIDPGTAMPIKT